MIRVLSRDGAPNDVLLVRLPAGQLRVLKRVRPDLRHREDLRLRLAQERRLLQELGAVHQLIGPAEPMEEDRDAMLLPYLDGGTLRERLDRLPAAGRAPSDLISRVAEDVGEALQYLHAHDVVHRDVNPTNVLFDAHGRAWLIDLSVAAVGRPARGLSEEWEEDRVGTIPYAPPEATLHPNEPALPSADVYALGVTLYELVAGSRPFERLDTESPEDFARRVMSAGRPPVHPLLRAGPAFAERIAAMLDPIAERRPPLGSWICHLR